MPIFRKRRFYLKIIREDKSTPCFTWIFPAYPDPHGFPVFQLLLARSGGPTHLPIDFEKDFANHMKELASEISGLHNDGLTYTGELETLYASRDLIQNGAFTYRRKGSNPFFNRGKLSET